MQSALTLHVGPLTFVSRTHDIDLTPDDWGRIDTATHWLAQGMRDHGARLMREIEDGHGVTGADRRFARLTDRGTLIVPGPKSGSIRMGGPALYVEDGKSQRVIVTSEAWLEPTGFEWRMCSFLDQGGDEFEVKASCLSPCDDLFRALPLAPEALETGKWAGVPQNAEGYQAALKSRAPVMDKFDRVAPVKPEDVRLDVGRMTAGQRQRLAKADAMLATAEQRKAARSHIALGRIRFGRMTPQEKAERAYAKEAYDALSLETAAASEKTEVSRGRVETLALEQMRGGAIESHPDGHLTRRNGLDTLLSSGGITRPEHVAGEKYAGIFGAAKTGEIKIANWNGSGGGSAPDPERERQRRLKEMAAKKALTDIEAFVQASVSHKRALWALRLVAGEGRLIAHVSTSGGNRATNTKALQLALEALAVKWGLQ